MAHQHQSPSELESEIRRRAQIIFEREGRPEGKEIEHWRRAELEVKEEWRHRSNISQTAPTNALVESRTTYALRVGIPAVIFIGLLIYFIGQANADHELNRKLLITDVMASESFDAVNRPSKSEFLARTPILGAAAAALKALFTLRALAFALTVSIGTMLILMLTGRQFELPDTVGDTCECMGKLEDTNGWLAVLGAVTVVLGLWLMPTLNFAPPTPPSCVGEKTFWISIALGATWVVLCLTSRIGRPLIPGAFLAGFMHGLIRFTSPSINTSDGDFISSFEIGLPGWSLAFAGAIAVTFAVVLIGLHLAVAVGKFCGESDSMFGIFGSYLCNVIGCLSWMFMPLFIERYAVIQIFGFYPF